MSTDSNQTPNKAPLDSETAKHIRQTRKQAAAAGSFVVFAFFVNMLLLGVFVVGPDFSTRIVVFIFHCILTIQGIGMTYWFFDAWLDYKRLLSNATQESGR